MSEGMSARVARQIFLRTMAPTRGAVSFSSLLADQMQDLYLPKGATIYRRGDAPEHIYFVVSGIVHLMGEDGPPWVMDARSVIGAIDANLDRPRTRTAVAITDVHLLQLRGDDYIEMLEDNFEQARGIVYNLTTMLRGMIATMSPAGGFEEPGADAYQSGKDVRPLNPIERLLALRSVPAFSSATVQALATLLEGVEDLMLPPGDLAIRPGGKDGSLWVVARGVIELERTTPQLSARFGPRSIVGGISSLAEDLRAAHLRALSPALVLNIPEGVLIDTMEDHFDLVRSVLKHAALERERLMQLKNMPVSRA